MSEETGVPEGVLKLIQRYEAFRQIYLKGEYNETQLRREFVDPLFRALGGDVDNNQGFSEARTDQEQTLIQRQIAATDNEIDERVYELNGLTEEERKIVEGTT